MYLLLTMKSFKSLSFFISLLAIIGCLRNDIREKTFQIDQLRTANDAKTLGSVLQTLNGINECQFNLDNHTMTVTFDGRIVYIKNIEYVIVNAGYSLPNWPADKKIVEKLKDSNTK